MLENTGKDVRREADGAPESESDSAGPAVLKFIARQFPDDRRRKRVHRCTECTGFILRFAKDLLNSGMLVKPGT